MSELLLTHASLDTFDRDPDVRADVDRLVGKLANGDRRDLTTLTETGQAETVDMIRDLANGYHVCNPDAGDITFLVAPGHRIIASGGRLILPAFHAPAKLGGHGPRFVSWVAVDIGHGDTLVHHGAHFVTRYEDHEHDVGARHYQQLRHARVMGMMMREAGRGLTLATGSADVNSSLPADSAMQRIFDEAGVTTTAHETGVDTPTHGSRRIDYVLTRDRDRRLEVKRMRVRRGAAWNSDHDPIDVWANIKERA